MQLLWQKMLLEWKGIPVMITESMFLGIISAAISQKQLLVLMDMPEILSIETDIKGQIFSLEEE